MVGACLFPLGSFLSYLLFLWGTIPAFFNLLQTVEGEQFNFSATTIPFLYFLYNSAHISGVISVLLQAMLSTYHSLNLLIFQSLFTFAYELGNSSSQPKGNL